MNSLFFICKDCRIYIDAGYRWAASTLETPGIVTQGQPVNLANIISSGIYWNPPITDDSPQLQEVLKGVREFFLVHSKHELIFGDLDCFFPDDSIQSGLDWMMTGFGADLDLSPRYLAEQMGFNRWQQVENHIKHMKHPPPWSRPGCRSHYEHVKAKFESIVNSKLASKLVPTKKF